MKKIVLLLLMMAPSKFLFARDQITVCHSETGSIKITALVNKQGDKGYLIKDNTLLSGETSFSIQPDSKWWYYREPENIDWSTQPTCFVTLDVYGLTINLASNDGTFFQGAAVVVNPQEPDCPVRYPREQRVSLTCEVY